MEYPVFIVLMIVTSNLTHRARTALSVTADDKVVTLFLPERRGRAPH